MQLDSVELEYLRAIEIAIKQGNNSAAHEHAVGLEDYRRQLHVQLHIKGNVRKPFGGTVSMGIPKGTLVISRKSKYTKVYVGGYSRSGISLHCCKTKKIISKSAKPKDLIVVKKLQWLTTII